LNIGYQLGVGKGAVQEEMIREARRACDDGQKRINDSDFSLPVPFGCSSVLKVQVKVY
jgi:hypothetical protein